MEPALVEAIKQGGFVAGAIIVAIAVSLVLRQYSADRKSYNEIQAPIIQQLNSSLMVVQKTNEASMARLQKSLDREEQDNSALKRQLLDAERRLASIEAQNKEQARAMEANVSLITSLQARILDLETLNREQIQRITIQDNRIEELESKSIQDARLIASLQEQSASQQDQIKQRTQEIGTLNEKLKTAERNLVERQRERDERDQKIEKLTTEVASLREQVNNKQSN